MIVLQGEKYKSIVEAARKHDLSYNTLLQRIKKHGNNDPHLFDKYIPKNLNYPTNFYYKGEFYSNLNQFAKAWGMDFRSIYSRWNRGIHNFDDLLLQGDFFANKIHELGYITIAELGEQTGMPKTILYGRIHNLVDHGQPIRIGLTIDDIVLVKDLNLPYKFNTKIVIKKSAIDHLNVYTSKLAHAKLTAIPQLMPIYLYDLQKHELWSSTHGTQGIYRKRHLDNDGWYSIALNSNDTHKIRYRIKTEDIEDLIKYPTIYAKDLITKKMILNSIPDCFNELYSGKTFYIKLVKELFEQKKHKRFDTSLLTSNQYNNSTVYGVTKAEARLIIRTATKKAKKQAEESKRQRQLQFKALLTSEKRQWALQRQSREAAKWMKEQQKKTQLHAENTKKSKNIKKHKSNRYQVTYNGKTYASLRELAQAYHVSYDLVLSRKEHGITDYTEMLKQPKKGNIGRTFTYHGHIFNNLREMADYLKVDYYIVKRLNHIYELNTVEDFIKALEERKHQKVNTPLSFPRKKRNNKRHEVILAGKKYNSVRQAAIEHNLTPSTLYGRIRKHGKDYKHLFDEPIDITTI